MKGFIINIHHFLLYLLCHFCSKRVVLKIIEIQSYVGIFNVFIFFNSLYLYSCFICQWMRLPELWYQSVLLQPVIMGTFKFI